MSEARKFDDDKVDWSLLPIEALEQVLKVFSFGAKKYDRNNYRNGFDSNRLVAASMRHITSWQKGEDLDPESGESHLAHAVCCLTMMMTNLHEGVLVDSRYKKEEKPPTLNEFTPDPLTLKQALNWSELHDEDFI